MLSKLGSMGWVKPGFNGAEPFGWGDIRDHSEMVCPVDDWEAETIYKMSEGYCAGLARGRKPLAIFPGDEEDG
jgi:hypothetical protein